MSTVCSHICQHPGCWKSTIDGSRLRKFTTCHRKEESSSPEQICTKNRKDVYDTLPTYNILNLLDDRFSLSKKDIGDIITDPSNGDTSVELKDFQHLSSFRLCQSKQSLSGLPITPSVPLPNNMCAAYMKKLWEQQKEVGKRGKLTHCCSKKGTVTLQSIQIQDCDAIGDEFEKAYTWIPGKKKSRSLKKKSEEVSKTVKLKTIDGSNIPEELLDDSRNNFKRLRSPIIGQPYKLRATPHRLPPLITDNIWNQLDLFQMLGISTNEYLTRDSRRNSAVKMPSPLHTKRMSIESQRFPSSKNYEKDVNNGDQSEKWVQDDSFFNSTEGNLSRLDFNQRTLYIKDGTMLPKSPENLKKSYTRKKNSRAPLHLTRVSVPKKRIRQVALFDHCSSSIKRAELPDVTMEPLSSSERSSNSTSHKSLTNTPLLNEAKESIPSHHSSIEELLQIHSSSSLNERDFRVPASSPVSNKSKPSPCPAISSSTSNFLESLTYITEVNESNYSKDTYKVNDFITEKITSTHESKEIVPVQESDQSTDIILKKDERRTIANDAIGVEQDQLAELYPTVGISTNINTIPSVIMMTKTSKSAFDQSKTDSKFNRVLSPTFSALSKISSEDCSIDKEIIRRTYDKYESLTPFKTPMNSHHIIPYEEPVRDQIFRPVSLPRSPTPSRRLLPQSMHNLDQYMPEKDASCKINNSFIKRNLSPSRSMFIRQPKQPALESVPPDIKVSQARILSDKVKSPFPVYPELKVGSKALHIRDSLDTGSFITPLPSVIHEAPPSSPTEIIEELDQLVLNCDSKHRFDPSHISNKVESEEFEKEIIFKEESLLSDIHIDKVQGVPSNTHVDLSKVESVHLTYENQKETYQCVSDLPIDKLHSSTTIDPDSRINVKREDNQVCNVSDSNVENELQGVPPLESSNANDEEHSPVPPICIENQNQIKVDEVNDIKESKFQAEQAHFEECSDKGIDVFEQLSESLSNRAIDNSLRSLLKMSVTHTLEETGPEILTSTNTSISLVSDGPSLQDFTDVLNDDFELDNEIVRAMDGFEDFLLKDCSDGD